MQPSNLRQALLCGPEECHSPAGRDSSIPAPVLRDCGSELLCLAYVFDFFHQTFVGFLIYILDISVRFITKGFFFYCFAEFLLFFVFYIGTNINVIVFEISNLLQIYKEVIDLLCELCFAIIPNQVPK